MEKGGLKNLRDLGGLCNKDGRRVRRHLLFRSACLHGLSAEESARLRDELGIRMIVDLRTSQEVAEKPDVVIDGVEYVHIPIFTESIIGITKETGADTSAYIKRTWKRSSLRAAVPEMRDIYAHVMTDANVVRRMAEVMHLIISNAVEGRATLFHCSQGKDRTGAISAFLLRLLDVDQETVVEDYVESNRVFRAKARKDYVKVLLFKLDHVTAGKVYRAQIADRRYIAATFDSVERLYGSVADFFRNGLDITDEMKELFKQRALQMA